MKMDKTCLFLVLLCASSGCGQRGYKSCCQDDSSWESKANGYAEEDAFPIFGPSRHRHLSEAGAHGKLYDFVLKVGPLSHWPEAKAKVPLFWGWGDPVDGSEGRQSAEHVLEMSLSLNGKAVHIPEDAYIDLERLTKRLL